MLKIFSPPTYLDYEKDKQSKFLHTALWLSFFASIYFASINSQLTATAFWVLAGTSLVGVYLNRIGKYFWSALLITSLATFAIFFNFYDGISLQDAGIVALPLLIIFSSFLFGRKMIIPISAIIIFGVSAIVTLERAGYISPPMASTNERVIVIDILLVISAILLRAIMKNWEESLQKTKASERELRDAYVLTLEGWAKTLEYHNRETEGHSRRVTSLCLRLAKAVGIDNPKDLEYIRWGALLHDIGKIGIPNKILNKQAKLTDIERKEIEKHPSLGVELIKDIPFMKPAVSIISSHHENWDGTGYPEGLSKNAIPIEARIFSIVDNWDALTNDRPYRPAWPKDKAKSYINEQSGEKFDPQIAQAFLDLID